MPRREDHEVHKRTCGAIGKKEIIFIFLSSKLENKRFCTEWWQVFPDFNLLKDYETEIMSTGLVIVPSHRLPFRAGVSRCDFRSSMGAKRCNVSNNSDIPHPRCPPFRPAYTVLGADHCEIGVLANREKLNGNTSITVSIIATLIKTLTFITYGSPYWAFSKSKLTFMLKWQSQPLWLSKCATNMKQDSAPSARSQRCIPTTQTNVMARVTTALRVLSCPTVKTNSR